MKQTICTITASLAVLGLGLLLTGVLVLRQQESGNLNETNRISGALSNYVQENSVEMNAKKNMVEIFPSTETVLEAKKSESSLAEETGPKPVEYAPQTVPPAAVPEGYTLPETVQLTDGSIGLLRIEKIGLSASVYEAEDEMEAMRKGVAHYPSTSAWEGNIGLCAHSGNGPACFFRDLHKLKIGDEITYTTALGTRQYVVDVVQEIAETDWSMLGRREDNRITMTTCIDGKPDKRLCVQAVEKEAGTQ